MGWRGARSGDGAAPEQQGGRQKPSRDPRPLKALGARSRALTAEPPQRHPLVRPTYLVNWAAELPVPPPLIVRRSDAGTVRIVDNGRIVRLEELDAIHVTTVQEVRYLNVAAAMNKFGGAARSGPVILVVMKKGG